MFSGAQFGLFLFLSILSQTAATASVPAFPGECARLVAAGGPHYKIERPAAYTLSPRERRLISHSVHSDELAALFSALETSGSAGNIEVQSNWLPIVARLDEADESAAAPPHPRGKVPAYLVRMGSGLAWSGLYVADIFVRSRLGIGDVGAGIEDPAVWKYAAIRGAGVFAMLTYTGLFLGKLLNDAEDAPERKDAGGFAALSPGQMFSCMFAACLGISGFSDGVKTGSAIYALWSGLYGAALGYAAGVGAVAHSPKEPPSPAEPEARTLAGKLARSLYDNRQFSKAYYWTEEQEGRQIECGLIVSHDENDSRLVFAYRPKP